MTAVYYISPSVLPSRAANAAHVVHQCAGFASLGAEVTLVAKRAVPDASALPAAVEAAYGVPAGLVTYDTIAGRSRRGENLRIAAHALRRLPGGAARPDLVLSRNLYAAYALAVVRRRPIVFETHQLETGLRKRLQRAVMTRPGVLTVVISDKLREALGEHHGTAPARVLVAHDAAPDGLAPLDPGRRRAVLRDLVPSVDPAPYATVCAYFGHLYAGRGIEIIAAMAQARPRVGFLVFGGNDADVAARRAAGGPANLHFVGHVPHAVAQRAMAASDVLLMPYQRSVSIGVTGHDTARWMSPMKMFEYMASGTPIVSSDLPVLREVLDHGRTALLAVPDDPGSWIACLDRLTGTPGLGEELGAAAHAAYRDRHTWTARARSILSAAGVR